MSNPERRKPTTMPSKPNRTLAEQASQVEQFMSLATEENQAGIMPAEQKTLFEVLAFGLSYGRKEGNEVVE